MANGTTDYSLGELKARTDSQERLLNEMSERIGKVEEHCNEMREYITEQKGGWKLVRNLGIGIGVLMTINTFIQILM